MADTAYQDLLKDTSESKENGDYFLVTITDLEPNLSYPLQFRWTYKDKTINDNWSAVKIITTPGESEPNTPNFTSSNVDVSSPEKIIITWDGKSDDTGNPDIKNYDRVDVYIDGAPFDGTKAAYSFKAPGTATIAAPAGTYQIVLYAVSKTGKLSPVSSAVTKTVVTAGEVIQTPTLPSGISAVASPFAVTINWDGSYSSSTFTGFKSIDIYAVGSDLGSTATSGISASNLVGSLTVNDTTNRINVGLDNLKQALSLASTQAAYTAPIFFYYNARNKNDVKYGSPTYTRINSTTVNPIQANYVDLASGVISIEHLEAGNGTFASWLRAGSVGGSRIELSAVNDFTDNGYTVQKGLVAYSSGNTEIFNLDTAAGTLSINGSGTFTGDLSAGSGNSIFKADSNGIYLGNATYASAPFSVSRNGVLKAESGTIGGWTLGSTYLQGTNLKLDTSGITVGSTSNKYLDISPSSIILRNANGTDAGIFTLTLGSSASLTMSGTISLNSSSTIDGTNASTVKTNAATGATAVQPGNGMSVDNTTKQVNQILLNTSGIGIYTATSGTRMQLTNSGLELYSGATRTVYLNGSTGSAEFTGTVTSSNLTATGGTIGGFSISSTYLGSSLVNNDPTFYINSSSGNARLNVLYINQASNTTGISMLNGANISMGGGKISLGSNGLIDITSGNIQSALGTNIDISGPNGTILANGFINSTSGYIASGTTDGTASTTGDDGVYLGPSGYVVARRDGISTGSSSVYYAARYYEYLTSNTNLSYFRALRDGTTVGNLRYNTSTSIFEAVTSSDYRLKENILIHDLTKSVNIIKSIPIKEFNFKSNPNKDKVVGFIAHELQEVLPFAVSGEKDAVDEDGNPEYQEVGFNSLVPNTVAALQYALNKIEELQARLDALEA